MTFTIIAFALLSVIMAGVIGINTKNIDHLSDQNNEMFNLTKEAFRMIVEQKKEIDILVDSDNSHSAEIDEIISKLKAITADIHRLDESTKQDHRDLVDIRERYILWRKPINWAGDYTETESEDRS